MSQTLPTAISPVQMTCISIRVVLIHIFSITTTILYIVPSSLPNKRPPFLKSPCSTFSKGKKFTQISSINRSKHHFAPCYGRTHDHPNLTPRYLHHCPRCPKHCRVRTEPPPMARTALCFRAHLAHRTLLSLRQQEEAHRAENGPTAK